MIDIKKLDNGVRLVMDRIEEVESVTLGIWVETGAVHESAPHSGISHFVEHMMFKGTEKRTPLEIAKAADSIGGQINAFTGKEATCYHIKVTAPKLFQGAEIIVDMLENSLFLKEEMDRERGVIEEEIKMTLDSPEDLVHDVSTELIFNGSSMAKSILGTPDTLSNIDSQVMKEYVKERYSRDNILISVAGKFNEDEIIEYFNRCFNELNQSSPNIKMVSKPYSKSFQTIEKDVEQCNLCMGIPTFSIEDKRNFALKVASNALGGTMSSRLFQNIRETQGLAYSIFSMSSGFRDTGYFKIYAGVGKDKIEDAIAGIRHELQGLSRDLITEEELAISKEQLKSGYIFSQESTAGRMLSNGRMAILMGKVLSMEELMQGYDRVDMNGIKEVVDIIGDMSQYSAATVSGIDGLPLEKYMEV